MNPLNADRVQDALVILDEWQNDLEHDPLATDYFPCQEALHLMNQLQLTGWIFYVDGKPSAFLVGESAGVSQEYIVHFAKAQKKIKGLYQYLYQALGEALYGQYEIINLEQDLGSPQVRLSKHSYHPMRMVHKWRIGLKQIEEISK